MKKRINLLHEFSIPLIVGVAIALGRANIDHESFHHFVHARLLGPLSVPFLTNDIFMFFFFGIAAAAITQSCMPGVDLNPMGKAVNPLLATLGGVVGPVSVGWNGQEASPAGGHQSRHRFHRVALHFRPGIHRSDSPGRGENGSAALHLDFNCRHSGRKNDGHRKKAVKGGT